MRTTFFALSALLVGAFQSTLSAQKTFSYTPGKNTYRHSEVRKTTQEVMGQKQEIDITTSQQVSLALTPKTGDSLAFVFTVDSAVMTASNPQAQRDLSKLVGTTVNGVMSKLGKAYTAVSSLTDAEGQNLAQGLKHFLVTFPENPKVGSTWVDTVTVKPVVEGLDITTVVVTTSKILGDTTVGGEKALRVEHNATLTTTGSGSQGGQALVFDGTGTTSGMTYVSKKGVYLGSSSTQNQAMTITVPAAGMTIPMTTAVTSKVERLGIRD
ncbi:MAG: hypothetical protein ABR543_16435 [Gemmatimonadaceae bacterium]